MVRVKKHTDELTRAEEVSFRAEAIAAEYVADKARTDGELRRELDQRRRDHLVLGIEGVHTWADFIEALELLADRARSVRRIEAKPRTAGGSLSALTQCEEILRALQFALVADDAVLAQLHGIALGYLRRGHAVDGRDALALKSGAATREPIDFGHELTRLLRDLPPDAPIEETAEAIAGAVIWRDCPFGRLRSMTPGHLLHRPKLADWIASAWDERGVFPEYQRLARSLLVALGLDETQAKNAIPERAR